MFVSYEPYLKTIGANFIQKIKIYLFAQKKIRLLIFIKLIINKYSNV